VLFGMSNGQNFHEDSTLGSGEFAWYWQPGWRGRQTLRGG
jgi:hypothetical protein